MICAWGQICCDMQHCSSVHCHLRNALTFKIQENASKNPFRFMWQVLGSFLYSLQPQAIQIGDCECSLKIVSLFWTKSLTLIETSKFRYLINYSLKAAVLDLTLTVQKHLTIKRALQTVQSTCVRNQIKSWGASKQFRTLGTVHVTSQLSNACIGQVHSVTFTSLNQIWSLPLIYAGFLVKSFIVKDKGTCWIKYILFLQKPWLTVLAALPHPKSTD